MRIKKHLFSITSLMSLLMLISCTTSPNHKHPLARNTPLNQICQHLKQEIAMDTVYNVPNELGYNPTQEAQYYKEYQEYRCDDFFAGQKNDR